jgi:hypothetical protein
MSWRFGLIVVILLLPGSHSIQVMIDKMKKAAVPFTKFCAENPAFAYAVLREVADSVVELAGDEPKKEQARNAKKMLMEIMKMAVDAEESKVRSTLMGTSTQTPFGEPPRLVCRRWAVLSSLSALNRLPQPSGGGEGCRRTRRWSATPAIAAT